MTPSATRGLITIKRSLPGNQFYKRVFLYKRLHTYNGIKNPSKVPLNQTLTSLFIKTKSV